MESPRDTLVISVGVAYVNVPLLMHLKSCIGL